MTGINVIMYYAVFLFQQAGLGSTSSSLLANGLQGLVLNISTFPNMWYMDKWGRRIPMIIGGVGMGISLMLIGLIMGVKGKSAILVNYREMF
jgi:MFS family permease